MNNIVQKLAYTELASNEQDSYDECLKTHFKLQILYCIKISILGNFSDQPPTHKHTHCDIVSALGADLKDLKYEIRFTASVPQHLSPPHLYSVCASVWLCVCTSINAYTSDGFGILPAKY